MPFTHKQFAEYLLCFGPALDAWPEHLRAAARDAIKTPEGAALLAQYKRFETALNARSFEPARPGLAGRIAASCRRRPQNISIVQWCLELLSEPMLPRPAFSLAMALALGLIIGLNTTTSLPISEYTAIEHFDDDGAAP